jgi:DNA modification methylase
MASEKTKRICRSVEIDPRYVALIVRRFEVATSNPAVLAETSETFKPLAPRRAR